MELTAARRHWKKESLGEAAWALPFSWSSSTTLLERCLVKSWEPYTPMIWSCGAQRNTLQLQTTDYIRRWTSWRLDKTVACQNQPKEDHLHHLQLSTNEQKANLHINGQTLLAEGNPTYLGVTFDKRLTWKQQTEKTEARANVRLAPIEKLAGTTWGADTVTLKRLYIGRVRPVLEYGMTAWGTTAKSNFDRISKVLNQATRIITGAMKSTPIVELETTTRLQ